MNIAVWMLLSCCYNVELVTAVCLYIYMLLGIMTGSWKMLLWFWKVLEFILGQTVGTQPRRGMQWGMLSVCRCLFVERAYKAGKSDIGIRYWQWFVHVYAEHWCGDWRVFYTGLEALCLVSSGLGYHHMLSALYTVAPKIISKQRESSVSVADVIDFYRCWVCTFASC